MIQIHPSKLNNTTINILLADDDMDDCQFFREALAELPLATSLTVFNDSQQFMHHLQALSANLPHALFLDLNMPRKNGFECLAELKEHSLLKQIPVIIFSTSYDEQKANLLYDVGAHYYISKPADYEDLKKVIHSALLLIQENIAQPAKENFLINKPKAVF